MKRGLLLNWCSVFLGLLVSYHQSIQQSLFSQLKSPRLAVRKRSIIALGMFHDSYLKGTTDLSICRILSLANLKVPMVHSFVRPSFCPSIRPAGRPLLFDGLIRPYFRSFLIYSQIHSRDSIWSIIHPVYDPFIFSFIRKLIHLSWQVPPVCNPLLLYFFSDF